MRTIANKKILIPSIIVVLALAGGGVYYLKSRAEEPKPTGFVNLDPPTEEEKQQAEDNKDRIVKEQEEQASQPPSNGGQKSVTPVITTAELYNGAVEVGGFVPGIFEDGGTCTVTLVKGSSKVTKQVQGVKNVSNTQCNGFSVPTSELSAGTWSVTLAYSSAAAQGTSAASTVEVK